GIVAIGSCRAGLLLPGEDFEIVNAGRIVTHGDLAFGVSLGLGDRGFDHAVDGQIVNSGLIKTEGDGAPGIVMIGNGHHLTNSGWISTDGDAFANVLRAAGVVVSGDNALVENTRTGIIESKNAASAAVELNVVERDGFPAVEMSSHLENFGALKGASVAVL